MYIFSNHITQNCPFNFFFHLYSQIRVLETSVMVLEQILRRIHLNPMIVKSFISPDFPGHRLTVCILKEGVLSPPWRRSENRGWKTCTGHIGLKSHYQGRQLWTGKWLVTYQEQNQVQNAIQSNHYKNIIDRINPTCWSGYGLITEIFWIMICSEWTSKIYWKSFWYV